jgi:hypothetical protein
MPTVAIIGQEIHRIVFLKRESGMIVIQKINRVTFAGKKRVYLSEGTMAGFTARITYFRKTG